MFCRTNQASIENLSNKSGKFSMDFSLRSKEKNDLQRPAATCDPTGERERV